MKKVLVLVPHFDDEVLGFGGAIQYHVQKGDNVSVCIVKKSLDKRAQIQETHVLEAKEILNYNSLIKLNLEPDLCNFNINSELAIEEILFDLSPCRLYIPHYNDQHQEHLGLFNMVKVALRNNNISSIKEVMCGEIVSSTGTAIKSCFIPNYFIPISSLQLDNKVLAMQCYREELKPFPHPRSEQGIRTTALFRGMHANSMFAEAFEVIKQID